LESMASGVVTGSSSCARGSQRIDGVMERGVEAARIRKWRRMVSLVDGGRKA
jgi:hypothetical protein